MNEQWLSANLRTEIEGLAGKLGNLLDQDGPDVSDAEMRMAYREGVENVRAKLNRLEQGLG